MPTLRTWAAASSGESVTRKSTSSGPGALLDQRAAHELQQRLPELHAHEHEGKWLIFPVWMSVRRLGHFVQRPEAAGIAMYRGVTDEHDLAHEEVAKRHPPVEVGIGRLLMGQLDVAADRPAAASLAPRLAASMTPGLHPSSP